MSLLEDDSGSIVFLLAFLELGESDEQRLADIILSEILHSLLVDDSRIANLTVLLLKTGVLDPMMGIGAVDVEKALVDLASSINLLVSEYLFEVFFRRDVLT